MKAETPDTGVVPGPDGLYRSPWAVSHPLLLDYYDLEWGMPVRGEQGLYERITLEGFQAGLSWLTILRKREAFRKAFNSFDPDLVALFSDRRLDALMAEPGIIRNRRKIEAARQNARATIALRNKGGLGELVWSFKPAATPVPRSTAEVPTSSPESQALSFALRKRDFAFVGPTTIYALMEAIGMVDTHIVGSHRRGSSGIWTE